MTPNHDARATALEAFAAYHLKPTSLVSYESAGHLLIIGDAAAHASYPGPDSVATTRLQVGMDGAKQADLCAHARDSIDINGYLGAFTVRFLDGHKQPQQLTVDMVLDLGAQPLLSMALPPPGYLHAVVPIHDRRTLDGQLQGMIGVFEKPRFFKYDATKCAHARNGRTVCTRCIDACPAEAIFTIGEKIEVNPNLCQGGGTCATACPSGAISYAYPSLADNGNRLRKMLHTYLQHGGIAPGLLIHSNLADDVETELARHDHLLPLQVEELGSAGPDLWLSALAFGAEQVLLLVDAEVPQVTLNNLREQLSWFEAVMLGLGLKRDTVRLVHPAENKEPRDQSLSHSPAQYAMPDDKRQALFQALDHLSQALDANRQVVELAAAAPFGEVFIDAGSCTLCYACVSACPGNALQDGSNRELPEIHFIESKCLQCGACTQTCPEDAITLSARLLFDRNARNSSRMLNQDRPFGCISCGKPFATHSVINKMTDKLKGHYMFANDRARDRLKMCEDCRVADIVQDPEAMQGQFDPLKQGSSGKPS